MNDLIRASSALTYIHSEDRDVWIRIGMALKSEFGEDGFDMWDSWSRSSPSYKPKDAKSAWRSFRRGGGTTIASLWHLARVNGWTEERVAPMTQEESDAAFKRRKISLEGRVARDKKEAEEKEKLRKSAVHNSQLLLNNAEISDHPYLKSKQLPEIMGLIQGDVLIIPMRGLDGDLAGSQLIWYHEEGVGSTDIFVAGGNPITFSGLGEEPEGFIKKFILGTVAKGSVFRIGNRYAPIAILCEGYATGLSIAKAAKMMSLDVTVMVCFSAFNTYHVSTLLKGYRRGIFADHDKSGKGEEYALKAGVPYIKSSHEGFDANDELAELGVFYLAKNVRQLVNSVK